MPNYSATAGCGTVSRMAAPDRVPLTPGQVVDAALTLTRERGIDGWSVRDLAAVLGTWPNTIAHHVGTREQVCEAVVERVVAQIVNPEPDLGWREWFRTFLRSGREVLLQYRGVARRLCRDGPTVPSAMPIMERGVTLLVEDGFGEDAPPAYSMLVNSGMLLVALADDRVEAGWDRGSIAGRMSSYVPAADSSPAWALMRVFFAGWSSDADGQFHTMFDFIVDRAIAGVDALPRRER